MTLRPVLLAVGSVVVAGLVAATLLVDRHVQPPPLGPGVEPMCLDAMRRSPPDRTWVAPRREHGAGAGATSVTLRELPLHDGQAVRVAGVLHAEFEWVALYSHRVTTMEGVGRAPWVRLDDFGGDLVTLRPAVSDRCVVVEGTYSQGPSGHLGMFNGLIRDVVRLEVWATPHWPFDSTPRLPPPPKS
jgi:hypothetical protein